MKQNYQLVIFPNQGEKTLKGDFAFVILKFRGTMWQANKAFDGLRVALNCSEFERMELQLNTSKNETGYKLNEVKFTGGGK